MKRFAAAASLGWLRRLLGVIVAVLAIAGTSYLVSHRLSNPDHYRYGVCPWYAHPSHGPPRSCRPPARAPWQIPLAVVVMLGGLGTALLVAGERPGRRAPASEFGARSPA